MEEKEATSQPSWSFLRVRGSKLHFTIKFGFSAKPADAFETTALRSVDGFPCTSKMFQDLCLREAREPDESASSCFICLGRFNSNAFSSRLGGNLAQMEQVWWIDLISSKVRDDVQRAVASAAGHGCTHLVLAQGRIYHSNCKIRPRWDHIQSIRRKHRWLVQVVLLHDFVLCSGDKWAQWDSCPSPAIVLTNNVKNWSYDVQCVTEWNPIRPQWESQTWPLTSVWPIYQHLSAGTLSTKAVSKRLSVSDRNKKNPNIIVKKKKKKSFTAV